MALPYVIAVRENKAARARDLPRISAAARRRLLPHTVVEDPIVEAAYAALHKAATRRRGTPTVLISGPSGSGKWHAARQFAAWRATEKSEWLSPTLPDSLDAVSTVLIRRLDTWPTEKLLELSSWRLRHADVAVAATWRTDVVPAAPLEAVARHGLVGAEQVPLPALSARRDIVSLGESIAEQNGISDGKIKQRLQYDLLTDVYPRNLHDLKTVLATAASRSKGHHPERAAYLEADHLADVGEAQALLYEAYQVLVGLHFSKGRPNLDEILDIVRALVIRCAQAHGRTEKQVGALLGCSQQAVSKSLKQKIRLSDWKTRLSLSDEKTT
jgi:transcriptional regulator of acetoin/glycerol metabolism